MMGVFAWFCVGWGMTFISTSFFLEEAFHERMKSTSPVQVGHSILVADLFSVHDELT